MQRYAEETETLLELQPDQQVAPDISIDVKPLSNDIAQSNAFPVFDRWSETFLKHTTQDDGKLKSIEIPDIPDPLIK